MRRARAAAAWAVAWVLMAAAGGAFAADRLCPQSPATAEPVASTLKGCTQAVCTAVGDETLCSCKVGAAWRFERRRGAQTLQVWSTVVSPMTGPGAFTVTSADIDGDGSPEWLVARLQGVSNGLGVSQHSLCVVWPQQALRAPVCRDVSEWGALTVLVQEDGRTGCSLMDSGWRTGRERRRDKRGEGTYAVGRLHRLQGQRWLAVTPRERPTLARRLLKDFEAERETLPQQNALRLWYQHPAAIEVPCPGPGPVCGPR